MHGNAEPGPVGNALDEAWDRERERVDPDLFIEKSGGKEQAINLLVATVRSRESNNRPNMAADILFGLVLNEQTVEPRIVEALWDHARLSVGRDDDRFLLLIRWMLDIKSTQVRKLLAKHLGHALDGRHDEGMIGWCLFGLARLAEAGHMALVSPLRKTVARVERTSHSELVAARAQALLELIDYDSKHRTAQDTWILRQTRRLTTHLTPIIEPIGQLAYSFGGLLTLLVVLSIGNTYFAIRGGARLEAARQDLDNALADVRDLKARREWETPRHMAFALLSALNRELPYDEYITKGALPEAQISSEVKFDAAIEFHMGSKGLGRTVPADLDPKSLESHLTRNGVVDRTTYGRLQAAWKGN